MFFFCFFGLVLVFAGLDMGKGGNTGGGKKEKEKKKKKPQNPKPKTRGLVRAVASPG